jgi:ribose transport system substrate-binding protein
MMAMPALAAPKRVAELTPSTKNPFLAAVADTFGKAIAGHDISVTLMSGNFDPALQARQVSDAIAQKYDLLAISAISAHAIIPALIQAKQAGIPVVLINNPIEEGHDDLFVTFVGENQKALGRIAGEELVKALHGRKDAKVAIIAGTLTEATAQLRIAGFKEAIAKNPEIKVVAVDDAHWDTANSERIAGQLFARYAASGGLDAIFAMADNMASGVVRSAQAAGVPLGTGSKDVILVSSNCMKFGIRQIEAGQQFSTATQMPGRTGKVAAARIIDYFAGKKLDKHYFLPVAAITKANVKEYADACTF